MRRQYTHAALVLAVCAPLVWTLCAMLAARAQANPADIFGYGSRSSALGGAVSADVSDASANYYNPGGLGWAEHTEVSLGFVHMAPTLVQDGANAPVGAVNAWQFGLVAPGRFWGLPVSFGLAAQVSGRRIARVVTFTEEDQRWFLYEHRPEQLFLVSNVALRVTPRLSLGGGFGFLASTDGVMRITGELVQPASGATQYDSRLDHEVLAELSSVRYPQLGASLKVLPELDLALVYRGEGKVTLDVDSDIEGNIHFGPLAFPTRYLLFSKTIQSWIPRQLTLGARFAPTPVLDLHVDLTWIDWSGLPSPVSATSSQLSIDTRGALFDTPQLPPATQLSSAHASGRLSPRLGAELRPPWGELGWSLRAGYAYQPTPLDADSSSNLLDADVHVFSFGAGLHLLQWGAGNASGLQLDAQTQWGKLGQRTQAAPGGEETSLTGHWVAVGAGLRLSL
jgi:long-chain fatty acid transport protein